MAYVDVHLEMISNHIYQISLYVVVKIMIPDDLSLLSFAPSRVCKNNLTIKG